MPPAHGTRTAGRRRSAFTLIELIVVVIIVGVLAAIAAVSYDVFAGNSRDTALLASAKTLSRAVAAASATDDQSSDTEVAAAWGAGGAAGSAAVKAKFFAAYAGDLTYNPGTSGAAGTLDVAAPAPSPRHACITLSTDIGATPTAALGACTPTVAPPAAVTGLTAAAAMRKITLTWTASPAATSYRVTSDHGLSTTVTTATYADSPLTDATSYSYTVTAMNAGGASAPATVTSTTPSGGNSVTDTFARANSATTLGTTSDGKQAWQPLAGTWGIYSASAYVAAAPANTRSLAVIDVASGDQNVTVTPGNGSQVGLAFRVSDVNNYWWVAAFNGALEIHKVVAGTDTGASAGTLPSGTPLKIQTYGNTINVYGNGVLLKTVTDPFNATATKAGVFTAAGGTGTSYRDLNFSAASDALSAPAQAATPTAATSPTAITLSWAANTDADLAGYHVYRDGVLAGTTTSPTFTDSTAGTSIHSYQIAAYDVFGNEGSKSAATQATVAPAGPISITDTFGRVNSTTTLGVTSDGKQPWQVFAGTWGISGSNGYVATAPASGPSAAVLDIGSGNQDISANMTNGSANGIAFRASDPRNYWYTSAANGVLELHKVVAGVNTAVSTSPNMASPVRVVAAGNTIKVYTGGVLQFTATDAFNATATKAGLSMSAGNSGTSYRFSYFTATGS